MSPFLLVLSSPSGGGKTAIARHLLGARDDVTYSVSATTRPKREGEQDGVAYHFLPREEFERRIRSGDFLEWAEYGGQLYGTLRSEVERGLRQGRHVVLDIEVQGAEQVCERFPNAVRVFVLPPSARVLAERLKNRGTDDEASRRRRLAIAADELTRVGEYDYVVVNDDLVEAVGQVAAILEVESRRVARLANLDRVVAAMRTELANGPAKAPSS
ncbi:MAG: guanylate kinase [Gemmatimonadales bacterium]